MRAKARNLNKSDPFFNWVWGIAISFGLLFALPVALLRDTVPSIIALPIITGALVLIALDFKNHLRQEKTAMEDQMSTVVTIESLDEMVGEILCDKVSDKFGGIRFYALEATGIELQPEPPVGAKISGSKPPLAQS